MTKINVSWSNVRPIRASENSEFNWIATIIAGKLNDVNGTIQGKPAHGSKFEVNANL